MAARTFVATITPANGGVPVDVVVFAEGALDAKCKIEAMHGPVRSWWSQPSEAMSLRSFNAKIIPECGGDPLYVSVLADGRMQAETLIALKYGPIRTWLSQINEAVEPEHAPDNPHLDLE